MSYEATLKARPAAEAARRSAGGVNTGNAPAGPGAEAVVCRHCEKENPGSRKFCGHCGKPLWEPCPKCGVEGPATEVFCGSCGESISAAYEERINRFESDLSRIAGFRLAADYNAALDVAAKLLRVNPLRLESRIAAVRELLTEITAERDRRLAEVTAVLAKARELQATQSYETAVTTLEEVPETLRDEDFKTFHEQVRSQYKEVLALGGEIRQALEEKRTLELMPKLDRLIQLQPNHAQARQLAEQLRDRYVQAAKKKLAGNQYQESCNLLRDIPSFLRNPEIEDLQVRAAELAWLLTDLTTAPVVDKPLLSVAERLVKFAPTNEQVKKLQVQLIERAKTKPKDPRVALPLWAAAPEKSRFGLPVEWLGGFARLAIGEKAEEEVAKQPGSLFVAAGLALQGVELSAVSVNLLPKQKTTLLGGLSSLGHMNIGRSKKKVVRAAWGLDLTETSLKAVKITFDEQSEKATLEACVSIEHKKHLGQPDAEADRHEILAATFKTFLDEHSLAGCKVCASLPSSKLLGRFIALPPLAKKQIPGVVEYEAKHQIPFPLSELIWDYELLNEDADFQEEKSHRVLLLAAKEFHVQDRLAAFKAAEINLDVLQSDAVALHNLATFEFHGEPAETPAQRTALALLDVGSDSTSLVVSSREGVWFRSTRLGGDDFTKALVRQFRLSFVQAEQLKRDPTKARRLSQLYEALDPVFAELVKEVERSLAAFENERTGLTVERLLAVGGGVKLHGLLRRLRVP